MATETTPVLGPHPNSNIYVTEIETGVDDSTRRARAQSEQLDAATSAPRRNSRVRNAWGFVTENFTLAEVSGSLGDLGTLIPLLVSLSKTGQVSLGASLIFGGLYNIITGAIYGIPMCVQPMKAISALALANSLSTGEIVSAGAFVSIMCLILGLTRTLKVVNAFIPLPLIRGIQLATGLTLINRGCAAILASKRWNFSDWAWMDNYVVALIAFGVALAMYQSKKNWSALLIFGYGMVVGCLLVWGNDVRDHGLPSPGLSWPQTVVPTRDEVRDGFLNGGLGQLPLTLLNSIIAVSRLADDLFPQKRRPVASVTSIATCIGFMNLTGMWFGSIPFCHGSGGLAAQYRFGARTSLSIYLLGAVKIILGLFFAAPLLVIFARIPSSALGVMLVLAGMELCSAAKDIGIGGLHKTETVAAEEVAEEGQLSNGALMARRTPWDSVAKKEGTTDFVIMAVTTGAILGFSHDGVGFLAGCLAAGIFQIRELMERGERINGVAIVRRIVHEFKSKD